MPNFEAPQGNIYNQIDQAGSMEELALVLEEYTGSLTRELTTEEDQKDRESEGVFTKSFSGPELAQFVRKYNPDVAEWAESNVPDVVLNKIKRIEA